MQEELMNLVRARRGHFLLESGHHGDLWLDLELLCLHPRCIQPFVAELARRLGAYCGGAVCGPLVEGAFVGLMVANELDVEFFYTEQLSKSKGSELFPVPYQIPKALRQRLSADALAPLFYPGLTHIVMRVRLYSTSRDWYILRFTSSCISCNVRGTIIDG